MPVISHCSSGGKNNFSVYTQRQEWEVWLWNVAWMEDTTRKEPRLALGKQQHPTEVSSQSSDAEGWDSCPLGERHLHVWKPGIRTLWSMGHRRGFARELVRAAISQPLPQAWGVRLCISAEFPSDPGAHRGWRSSGIKSSPTHQTTAQFGSHTTISFNSVGRA